ncbi:DNA mismatch repair protein MutL [Daldinia caldariorum]|uniref:DNA mismatch repair protein MutL n=1 Tax=Daldinia caldariorum TaxID=326644 RepID=UPI002007729C|nr:DNA mismatch repair protein MutL [Daldinia caldariorum]KAI1470821.1 DNA mismatch repair protein MutL [Daldinia caldariorum]
MATIKAIEARTIHQIQSGQVIVDLCSVVKELVENSLDAGATNIEVRFKNQGLDSIEVQDNGSGISKQNYETLALKHYTSKLSTYADLSSLQTFGFRGEALSSLCALSKFTVTTCLASDAPKGSKLEFETSGKLRSTSIVAAQKGTTVTVEGIFHNLPVRRRELERNIKREWNKVIGVLNQYACIQTGLKFSVSQQPNKGKRIVLFSTKGNQTTRENIVNVFGSKTLAVLIPLDLKLQLELTSAPGQKWSTQGNNNNVHEIHIKGHVSRPAHGEGRQTPDRQMFFVNGRPCGLPQFTKIFNEVYKSYNASQSPFIFADIQLDTHLYDVNVSPDKRTILLHDQTRMLDSLRESLTALFESQDYALPTSQLAGSTPTPFKKSSINRQNTPLSEIGLKRSISIENEPRRISISMNTDDIGDQDKDEDDESTSDSVRRSLSLTRPLARNSQDLDPTSQGAEPKSDVCANISSATVKTSEGGGKVASESKGHIFSKFATDYTDDINENENENNVDGQLSPSASSEESTGEETDFRARLAELKNVKASRRDSIPSPSTQEIIEPPIPAVSTSSRVSDIKMSRVSSSSAVKRSAPEVATITVGNHTVTSIIGSPSKKQRTGNDKAREPSTRQRSSKGTTQMPSFNGRLTQMFAAHSQAKKTELVHTTPEGADLSDDSDGSSEQLFVEDDDEDDEQNDQDEEPALSEVAAESIEEQDRELDSQSPEPENVQIHPQSDMPPSLSPSIEGEKPGEQVEDTREEVDLEATVAATHDPKSAVSEETQKRTQSFIKGGAKKKDSTVSLLQTLRTDEKHIRKNLAMQQEYLKNVSLTTGSKPAAERLDAEDAEEKLSLTISKADFGKMKIIGQFNLGFILAIREAKASPEDTEDTKENRDRDDELFIIDQHATDEKYNFERLQASTVVQSQRLVLPKALELTALEEEVIRENLEALEANGFIVAMDESGDQPVGSRCQLLSLPLSRETTFSLADLEELISMLTDHQSSSASSIPRPSKVRKMFAMRACRSSVMIGKSLTIRQMEKLVRHMGELDKPWNCPHGRPTMRHLCGLGAWTEMAWKEGDGLDGERTPKVNWGAYVREKNEL